ncbi:Pre-mRNA-splicing factor SPF27 [Delphinella strobiligena]|nr:Pre-mRNA-splicing factor SPF27 [Delphinella strobiligena]
MPLIQSSQDYLPYIDSAPSQDGIASAKALIAASLPQDYQTALHERIPQQPEFKFSELIEAEHTRIAAGAPKEGGIDLSRYEAQDAPTSNDIADWRTVLQKAYTSSEYLQSRVTNLSLLETYGKNAWLISNDQLEHILRDAENEVVARKQDVEALEQERRTRQEASKGEIQSLEQSWRVGVGRMIEVEVAAEGLRREILERKRLAAR